MTEQQFEGLQPEQQFDGLGANQYQQDQQMAQQPMEGLGMPQEPEVPKATFTPTGDEEFDAYLQSLVDGGATQEEVDNAISNWQAQQKALAEAAIAQERLDKAITETEAYVAEGHQKDAERPTPVVHRYQDGSWTYVGSDEMQFGKIPTDAEIIEVNDEGIPTQAEKGSIQEVQKDLHEAGADEGRVKEIVKDKEAEKFEQTGIDEVPIKSDEEEEAEVAEKEAELDVEDSEKELNDYKDQLKRYGATDEDLNAFDDLYKRETKFKQDILKSIQAMREKGDISPEAAREFFDKRVAEFRTQYGTTNDFMANFANKNTFLLSDARRQQMDSMMQKMLESGASEEEISEFTSDFIDRFGRIKDDYITEPQDVKQILKKIEKLEAQGASDEEIEQAIANHAYAAQDKNNRINPDWERDQPHILHQWNRGYVKTAEMDGYEQWKKDGKPSDLTPYQSLLGYSTDPVEISRLRHRADVIPDAIRGNKMLEGGYKTLMVQMPQAVEGMNLAVVAASNEKATERLAEIDVMLKNGQWTPDTEIDVLGRWKDFTGVEQGGYRKMPVKDAIEYYRALQKEFSIRAIENIEGIEEFDKQMQAFDHVDLFDKEGLTIDKYKSLLGEQIPQMAGAVATFGLSAFVQEFGGGYIDNLKAIAAKKYGLKVGEEPTAEMLKDIVLSGEDERGTALAAGTISAAFEYVGAKQAGKLVFNNGLTKALLRGEFLKTLKNFSGTKITMNALEGGLVEGLTEGLQTLTMDVSKGIATNEPIKVDPNEFGNAVAAGALIGATIPFVGGSTRNVYRKVFNPATGEDIIIDTKQEERMQPQPLKQELSDLDTKIQEGKQASSAAQQQGNIETQNIIDKAISKLEQEKADKEKEFSQVVQAATDEELQSWVSDVNEAEFMAKAREDENNTPEQNDILDQELAQKEQDIQDHYNRIKQWEADVNSFVGISNDIDAKNKEHQEKIFELSNRLNGVVDPTSAQAGNLRDKIQKLEATISGNRTKQKDLWVKADALRPGTTQAVNAIRDAVVADNSELFSSYEKAIADIEETKMAGKGQGPGFVRQGLDRIYLDSKEMRAFTDPKIEILENRMDDLFQDYQETIKKRVNDIMSSPTYKSKEKKGMRRLPQMDKTEFEKITNEYIKERKQLVDGVKELQKFVKNGWVPGNTTPATEQTTEPGLEFLRNGEIIQGLNKVRKEDFEFVKELKGKIDTAYNEKGLPTVEEIEAARKNIDKGIEALASVPFSDVIYPIETYTDKKGKKITRVLNPIDVKTAEQLQLSSQKALKAFKKKLLRGWKGKIKLSPEDLSKMKAYRTGTEAGEHLYFYPKRSKTTGKLEVGVFDKYKTERMVDGKPLDVDAAIPLAPALEYTGYDTTNFGKSEYSNLMRGDNILLGTHAKPQKYEVSGREQGVETEASRIIKAKDNYRDAFAKVLKQARDKGFTKQETIDAIRALDPYKVEMPRQVGGSIVLEPISEGEKVGEVREAGTPDDYTGPLREVRVVDVVELQQAKRGAIANNVLPATSVSTPAAEQVFNTFNNLLGLSQIAGKTYGLKMEKFKQGLAKSKPVVSTQHRLISEAVGQMRKGIVSTNTEISNALAELGEAQRMNNTIREAELQQELAILEERFETQLPQALEAIDKFKENIEVLDKIERDSAKKPSVLTGSEKIPFKISKLEKQIKQLEEDKAAQQGIIDAITSEGKVLPTELDFDAKIDAIEQSIQQLEATQAQIDSAESKAEKKTLRDSVEASYSETRITQLIENDELHKILGEQMDAIRNAKNIEVDLFLKDNDPRFKSFVETVKEFNKAKAGLKSVPDGMIKFFYSQPTKTRTTQRFLDNLTEQVRKTQGKRAASMVANQVNQLRTTEQAPALQKAVRSLIEGEEYVAAKMQYYAVSQVSGNLSKFKDINSNAAAFEYGTGKWLGRGRNEKGAQTKGDVYASAYSGLADGIYNFVKAGGEDVETLKNNIMNSIRDAKTSYSITGRPIVPTKDSAKLSRIIGDASNYFFTQVGREPTPYELEILINYRTPATKGRDVIESPDDKKGSYFFFGQEFLQRKKPSIEILEGFSEDATQRYIKGEKAFPELPKYISVSKVAMPKGVKGIGIISRQPGETSDVADVVSVDLLGFIYDKIGSGISPLTDPTIPYSKKNRYSADVIYRNQQRLADARLVSEVQNQDAEALEGDMASVFEMMDLSGGEDIGIVQNKILRANSPDSMVETLFGKEAEKLTTEVAEILNEMQAPVDEAFNFGHLTKKEAQAVKEGYTYADPKVDVALRKGMRDLNKKVDRAIDDLVGPELAKIGMKNAAGRMSYIKPGTNVRTVIEILNRNLLNKKGNSIFLDGGGNNALDYLELLSEKLYNNETVEETVGFEYQVKREVPTTHYLPFFTENADGTISTQIGMTTSEMTIDQLKEELNKYQKQHKNKFRTIKRGGRLSPVVNEQGETVAQPFQGWRAWEAQATPVGLSSEALQTLSDNGMITAIPIKQMEILQTEKMKPLTLQYDGEFAGINAMSVPARKLIGKDAKLGDTRLWGALKQALREELEIRAITSGLVENRNVDNLFTTVQSGEVLAPYFDFFNGGYVGNVKYKKVPMTLEYAYEKFKQSAPQGVELMSFEEYAAENPLALDSNGEVSEFVYVPYTQQEIQQSQEEGVAQERKTFMPERVLQAIRDGVASFTGLDVRTTQDFTGTGIGIAGGLQVKRTGANQGTQPWTQEQAIEHYKATNAMKDTIAQMKADGKSLEEQIEYASKHAIENEKIMTPSSFTVPLLQEQINEYAEMISNIHKVREVVGYAHVAELINTAAKQIGNNYTSANITEDIVNENDGSIDTVGPNNGLEFMSVINEAGNNAENLKAEKDNLVSKINDNLNLKGTIQSPTGAYFRKSNITQDARQAIEATKDDFKKRGENFSIDQLRAINKEVEDTIVRGLRDVASDQANISIEAQSVINEMMDPLLQEAAPEDARLFVLRQLQKNFPDVKIRTVSDEQMSDFLTEQGIDPNKVDTVHGVLAGKNKDVILIKESDFDVETPIHEFGHIWVKALKTSNKDLYKKGQQLIQRSSVFSVLEQQSKDPNSIYHGYSPEQLLEEAMATAIGRRGKRVLFRNASTKTAWAQWVKKAWSYISEKIGIPENVENLKLNEFLDIAVAQLITDKPSYMGTTDNDLQGALQRRASLWGIKGMLANFNRYGALGSIANTLAHASNDDFYGLVERLLPRKGALRNEFRDIIKNRLFQPLKEANADYAQYSVEMQERYDNAKVDAFGKPGAFKRATGKMTLMSQRSIALESANKFLAKDSPITLGRNDLKLSNSQVVQIYNYLKDPSLYGKLKAGNVSTKVMEDIVNYVQADPRLQRFADAIPGVYAQFSERLNSKLDKFGVKPFTPTKINYKQISNDELAILESVSNGERPVHAVYTPFTAVGQAKRETLIAEVGRASSKSARAKKRVQSLTKQIQDLELTIDVDSKQSELDKLSSLKESLIDAEIIADKANAEMRAAERDLAGEDAYGILEGEAGMDISNAYTVMAENLKERKKHGQFSIRSSNTDSQMQKYMNGPLRTMAYIGFAKNASAFFNTDNLRNAESKLGKLWATAMRDSMRRIISGSNRQSNNLEEANKFERWLNRSVGTTMFLNIRSATLQLISTPNFMIDDPMRFMAHSAYSPINAKYRKRAMQILVKNGFVRMRGMGSTDVVLQEMAKQRGDVVGEFVDRILRKGYAPTRIADKIAIGIGGLPYLSGQIQLYEQQGYNSLEAERLAEIDFVHKANEAQQSTSPDRMGRIQTTKFGKYLLTYTNAVQQFNRIMAKSLRQMQAGENVGGNIAKISYLATSQLMLFSYLQRAMFMNDDNDETTFELMQGVMDSVISSIGLYGQMIATAINTAIATAEAKKQYKKITFLKELLNLSPVIGTKARELSKGLGLEVIYQDSKAKFKANTVRNAYLFQSLTGYPAARYLRKYEAVYDALNANDLDVGQRILRLLGWSRYDLDARLGKRKGGSPILYLDADYDLTTIPEYAEGSIHHSESPLMKVWNEKVYRNRQPSPLTFLMKVEEVKDQEPGVLGRANKDGTIEINPDLPPALKKKVMAHEGQHAKDLKDGRLNYTDKDVEWEGVKYPRKDGKIKYNGKWLMEGDKSLPWEAAADKAEDSPLEKSRGARKAEQNEKTKAAHAQATKEHWDELGSGDKVSYGDIAMSAAGALPGIAALGGASKAAKLVKKAAGKYGKTGNTRGGIEGAVDSGITSGAGSVAEGAVGGVGSSIKGSQEAKLKKKAAEFLVKGIAGNAADAAKMAAKSLGIVGIGAAAYKTGELINKKMYQEMTPEEQERRRTITASQRRGRGRSPVQFDVKDRLADFVAAQEGFKDTTYADATGIPTIGYGRTGKGVVEGMTTNEADEKAWLQHRLDNDRSYVQKKLRQLGYSNVNPNQLDALTSFVYNVGKGRLAQITRDGSRSMDEVGNALLKYNKAGGQELPGLTARRTAEVEMFFKPYEQSPEVEATMPMTQKEIEADHIAWLGSSTPQTGTIDSTTSPLQDNDKSRKGQVLTEGGKIEQDYVGKLAGIAEEAPGHSERFRASYEANADKIQAQGRAERSKALQIEDEKQRKKAVKAAEQKEKQLLNQAHQQLMGQTKAVSDAAKASAQAAKDEYKSLTKEASDWSKDHDKQLKERDKAFSDKGTQKALVEKRGTDEYKKSAQEQVADFRDDSLENIEAKANAAMKKPMPFSEMPPHRQNYIRMRKAKELGLTGADLKSPYKVKLFLAKKQMLNPEDWAKAKG